MYLRLPPPNTVLNSTSLGGASSRYIWGGRAAGIYGGNEKQVCLSTPQAASMLLTKPLC